MTEIEPVGYAMKVDGKFKGLFEEGSKLLVPLYTKEQLQPRVKMNKAEFDEWKELDFENNIFGFLSQLLDDVTEPNYPNLTNRIYGSNGDGLEDNSRQLELCELWANYNPYNPEETIEVLPEKKWFVRSKEADEDGDWLFLSNISKDKFNDRYCYSRDKKGVLSINSHAFDTKEEAEEWTNPLCEAVLLPVEEEK